ncbi:hypothetical protein [Saccharolobus caldissimus]|uniref:Uncharacterized protein n=1 Tax=Saccharolobus caldissimus TaxID=1702097 RepID=A0AAQ4CR26_9CREN|nr:hypothetical protein [Saccharolobus caldissimus]BDB98257.1 hypothetical protein SACC_12740 [Saccharolobus caldissimus]
MEKNLIKDSKELANRIIKNEYRKALGKYYLLWSTYSIILFVVYGLLYILNYSSIYGAIIQAFLSIVYIFFTAQFFTRASAASKRYSEVFKLYNSYIRFIYKITFMGFILGSALFYLGYLKNSFLITLIGVLIFVTSIDINLILTYPIAGGIKTYDIIAIVTFSAMMLLYILTIFYIFEITFLTFTLSWIYAGYRSLMEVIEGE